jgi:predicted ABC-type transport system involved in lysophospholipase L1 biosynthesis ATPase subunit
MAISGLSKDERRKRAEELLEIVGLKERVNHKPTELSGGEQQRVAIARAAISELHPHITYIKYVTVMFS